TFHEGYYELLSADPGVRQSPSKLSALGGTIASSMEGMPFEAWLSQQQVVGIADQFGLQVYQYVRSGLACVFRRYSFGYEETVSGADVDWRALDGDGVVIDAGSEPTDPTGFLPLAPVLPAGAEGRLTVQLRARMDSETAENSAVRTMLSLSGLFGVVVGEERGTVTITPLDSAMAPVACAVVHGQFAAPELEHVAGRFRLSYAGPEGAHGERMLTKDASSYMAVMQPIASTRSAVLVARPSVTRQGCRFLLDRSVAGPARLTLYDVAGRILQVLDVPEGSSGIDWNGADRSGYLTHNGVIVARLTAPGVDAS